jgi:hypothetical protein
MAYLGKICLDTAANKVVTLPNANDYAKALRSARSSWAARNALRAELSYEEHQKAAQLVDQAQAISGDFLLPSEGKLSSGRTPTKGPSSGKGKRRPGAGRRRKMPPHYPYGEAMWKSMVLNEQQDWMRKDEATSRTTKDQSQPSIQSALKATLEVSQSLSFGLPAGRSKRAGGADTGGADAGGAGAGGAGAGSCAGADADGAGADADGADADGADKCRDNDHREDHSDGLGGELRAT